MKTKDRKIHLQIPEMLAEWERLGQYADPALDYPFILMAGERRSYNANQIFRDPGWRKVDHDGALRLHPADARTLGLKAGDRARCESAHGQVEVVVSLDDSVQPGQDIAVTATDAAGNNAATPAQFDGIGSVMTSSPNSPTIELPSSS